MVEEGGERGGIRSDRVMHHPDKETRRSKERGLYDGRDCKRMDIVSRDKEEISMVIIMAVSIGCYTLGYSLLVIV